jgi:adenylate cyclase
VGFAPTTPVRLRKAHRGTRSIRDGSPANCGSATSSSAPSPGPPGLVRTNVQLVDAATGAQLWGDRFENEFADLPRLETAITGGSLLCSIISWCAWRAGESRGRSGPTRSILRLRATSLFFGSLVPENTLAARYLLRRSLSLDPSLAEAWARLSELTVSDHLNRWNSADRAQIAEAEEAARKALSLAPNNALAYVASGLIHRAREEHHSAIESFTRALELDPNSPSPTPTRERS